MVNTPIAKLRWRQTESTNKTADKKPSNIWSVPSNSTRTMNACSWNSTNSASVCTIRISNVAKQAIAAKEYEKAIRLLNECLEYPRHLGEGKLHGAQENDFHYLLGIAYEAMGKADKAMECWEEATKGPQEPAAAMYYNDAKPDKIFYQGMALLKLCREGEARGRFYKLINFGKQHLFEKQVMDYFAVSLPDMLIWDDSLDTKNIIHCKYMLALGYYGMGDKAHALRYLTEVEALDNNHQGIQQLRSFIDLAL